MKKQCPHFKSKKYRLNVIRDGFYVRSSDHQKIRRFYCKICCFHFSQATFRMSYRQKKRPIHSMIKKLLCSGVSQRRAAKILQINRKTVVRKLHLLAQHAEKEHQTFLLKPAQHPLSSIQFDDLETSEHTKCKPVSVTLAVDPKTRKIMTFQVSRMPAKGHLAAIARNRYGYRKDERPEAWNLLMKSLTLVVKQNAVFTSDQNPHYPKPLRTFFPQAQHCAVLGREACVVGQGELKRGGHDPLFALNHTCAMLRANMNRLFRRTWCTTKTLSGLISHLWLYLSYHNHVLTASSTAMGTSY